MNTRLLEGAIDDATAPDVESALEIDRLKREVSELRFELADTKRALARERAQAAHATDALRKQLAPLYHALQMVFGELDAIGDATEPAGPHDARTKAVWESWKAKLGTGPAKVIDALLLHGELSTQQLSIATGYHRNTVPQYVSQLHKAGLINKAGGRFSLKAL
jgi:hypothetical protein